MTKKSEIKKLEQLGIPYGTASNILRKMLLFSFVQKAGMDYCYQCGEKIESVDDLSIEHKKPWLDTENPKELFFDLNNIAYSHLKCNIKAIRKEYLIESGKRWSRSHIIETPEGMAHCWNCKENKNISEFGMDKTHFNGLDDECKKCKKERRKKYSGIG